MISRDAASVLFRRLRPLNACSVPKSGEAAYVKVQEYVALTPITLAALGQGPTPCEMHSPSCKLQGLMSAWERSSFLTGSLGLAIWVAANTVGNHSSGMLG